MKGDITKNVDMCDEDEEVVIKGSAMYEYLSKLGYTDFESAERTAITTHQQSNVFRVTDNTSFFETIYGNLFSTCSWITQEHRVSEKQLKTILNSEVLLEDHAHAIHTILQKFPYTPWKVTLRNMVITSMIVVPSTYALLSTHRHFSTFIASLMIFNVGSTMYLHLDAHKDLKLFIHLQNEVYSFCKSALKILKCEYKLKSNSGKPGYKFHDLNAGRLIFLQGMLENVVKCLEYISHIYYTTSRIIIDLLPTHISKENLITRLEPRSLKILGEINYQILKDSFDLYILVQSEMLHVLAVAYDYNTWRPVYKSMPKVKLAHIIRYLIKHLMKHKHTLKHILDAYYAYKTEQMQYQFMKSADSKWQDLYVHLYLTLQKLQLAYSHIASLITDIDTHVNTTNDIEIVEMFMKKMNDAYNEINNAKNFAEFSSLLIARARITFKNDNSAQSTSMEVIDHDVPVITDSEPQIVDEVFEEYIKEEYLKPLYEESEELLQDYRIDKLLAKNFMCELKEVLIDKYKSMAERESKALQRMYKNVVKEPSDHLKSNANTIPVLIPPPPPMPSFKRSVQTYNTQSHKGNTEIHADINGKARETYELTIEAVEEKNAQLSSLSPIFNKTDMASAALNFSPLFLKVDEETFVGNGENSEDESFIEPVNQT